MFVENRKNKNGNGDSRDNKKMFWRAWSRINYLSIRKKESNPNFKQITRDISIFIENIQWSKPKRKILFKLLMIQCDFLMFVLRIILTLVLLLFSFLSLFFFFYTLSVFDFAGYCICTGMFNWRCGTDIRDTNRWRTVAYIKQNFYKQLWHRRGTYTSHWYNAAKCNDQ